MALKCTIFPHQYIRPNDAISGLHQMISQIFYAGFNIAEVTCPTKYFPEASSINFSRSAKYGMGVLGVSFNHFFNKLGLVKSEIYKTRN